MKSIQERCESYNGEKAEISLKAKQLVEGLIEEFEKYHAMNKGIEAVEEVQ